MVGCLLVVTGSLWAAEEETSHEKAAKEFIQLSDSRAMMKQVFDATIEPMLKQMPEDKRGEVKAAFDRFGKQVFDSPELSEAMVKIYVEAFTETELKEMTDFYSTPTGRKALAQMPLLAQKGAEIGQQVAEKHQAGLQKELEEILGGGADEEGVEGADEE